MSLTIETDLKEVLSKIDQKIDKLDLKIDKLEEKFDLKIDKLTSDVNELKTEQAKTSEQLKAIATRLEKVEGSQKNQIWVLITILGTVVIGFVARLFVSGNP